MEKLSPKVIPVGEFLGLNSQRVAVLFLIAEIDLILLISLKDDEIYLASFVIRYPEESKLTYAQRACYVYEFFGEKIKPKLDLDIIPSPSMLMEERTHLKKTSNFPDYR